MLAVNYFAVMGYYKLGRYLISTSSPTPHASFSINNLAELSIDAGDYEVTLALVRAIAYRVSICMVIHVGIHG